jgi:hypothetical protein
LRDVTRVILAQEVSRPVWAEVPSSGRPLVAAAQAVLLPEAAVEVQPVAPRVAAEVEAQALPPEAGLAAAARPGAIAPAVVAEVVTPAAAAARAAAVSAAQTDAQAEHGAARPDAARAPTLALDGAAQRLAAVQQEAPWSVQLAAVMSVRRPAADPEADLAVAVRPETATSAPAVALDAAAQRLAVVQQEAPPPVQLAAVMSVRRSAAGQEADLAVAVRPETATSAPAVAALPALAAAAVAAERPPLAQRAADECRAGRVRPDVTALASAPSSPAESSSSFASP